MGVKLLNSSHLRKPGKAKNIFLKKCGQKEKVYERAVHIFVFRHFQAEEDSAAKRRLRRDQADRPHLHAGFQTEQIPGPGRYHLP